VALVPGLQRGRPEPGHCFADPDLRAAEAATNALGLPLPHSGNFADVYQLRSPAGRSWAVKCFTRQVPDLRDRYRAVSAHLAAARLPFTVDFEYLEQGPSLPAGPRLLCNVDAPREEICRRAAERNYRGQRAH
jgi:hypothetical protein